MIPNDRKARAAEEAAHILATETAEAWPEAWSQLINRLAFRGAYRPADGVDEIVARTMEFVLAAREFGPSVGIVQMADILHRQFDLVEGAADALLETDSANQARRFEQVL